MSNFSNLQKSRTTNTSWGSERASTGTTLWSTVNISNNQHHSQTNLPQGAGSVTTSTTSSSFASSNSDTAVHTSCQRNTLAQAGSYFAPSSDGVYLWPNIDRRNRNTYSRNEQRMSSPRSLDLSQSSSGTTSSTESGFFSGGSSDGDINLVIISKVSRNNHLNFPQNHRNGSGFNKCPPGMSNPTPATHFASSKHFNAPAASSLPQPPQIWLFGRAEALVKEEDLEEERTLEKGLNTTIII